MVRKKSNEASVSVVIPTYNSAAWLTETLNSVLSQTIRPAQIIVVDDGSTDHTVQVLQPFKSRIEYVVQPNQGVSAARNRGVRLARQPFVAFLDADDLWHPMKLEMQLKVLRDQKDVVLLGTRSFDWPAPQLPQIDSSLAINPVSWKQLVVKNHLITSSVIVRRDALSKAGLFDTELQGPEDRDLWLRLAKLGDVANLQTPLTGYRQVHGSVSKQPDRCYVSMRRIIEKLTETGQLRGHWLLRRKALGQIENTVACIWSESGEYPSAMRMLLRSFAYYPLPYGSSETDASMERARRLAVYFLRLLGIKPCPPLTASMLSRSVIAKEAKAAYV